MNPKDNIADIRLEIDRSLSEGFVQAAAVRMGDLWQLEQGSSTAAFLVSRIEKLRGLLNLTRLRVAILRSYTLEPVIPLLRAAAFRFRIDTEVQVGDYNTYMQEVLDPNSSLYRFAPDVVIVAVRLADLALELWQGYSGLEPAAVQDAVQRVCRTLEELIRSFRERSHAALIVHTMEQPTQTAFGVLDLQVGNSQSEAIQAINRELRRIAQQHRGVYVLDYENLIARHGRLLWQDERKLLTVGLPIAAHGLIHLANEWLRFLVPLSGRIAKALVVDLDNTVWGGVIGEDGMTGIKLGPDHPEAAYQNLQRALLDVSRRGILLAICSKNNREDAMEVLEKHRGMLLRPADFAAMRINWNDKVQGIREIAAELNIGFDSVAFLDDNPFEREQVRRELPDVMLIDLPKEPMQYAFAVRDFQAFERLSLSSEDRERNLLYSKQRDRDRAEEEFQSKEDFYRYLQQEADIEQVTSSTIARIAQLTQKTNQFNLTTHRYNEQQIAEMVSNPVWEVLSVRVKDRFGDHGLVGVAITHDERDTCEIDTFLLSCRVIGRSLETALLSHIAQCAAARGRKHLAGWFLPTKKNTPAAEFYARSGFQCQPSDNTGQRWIFNLEDGQIRCPEWIRLNIFEGGRV